MKNNHRFRSRQLPKGDYEVGYGRPPQHSRWKPGQSGNERGRKGGSKGLNTILDQTFLEKIAIRKDGVLMRVTKLEAMCLKMMEMALKGNVKASMALFGLAQQYRKFEP